MSDFFAAVAQRLETAAGHLRLTSLVSWPVIVIFVLGSPLNQSFLVEDALQDQVALHLGLIFLSSVIVFVPLWLLGRVNGRGQRAEPGLVIVSVVVLCALRSILLTSALTATGVPPVPTTDRLALTVTSSVTLLVLTIIVDSVRLEVERVNRLRALQEAIDRTRAQTAQALRAEREVTIGEVTEAVTSVVDQLPELPRREAVTGLREVAFGVVRPTSHRLVATMPDIEVSESSVLEYPLDLPEVTSEATETGRLPIYWFLLASVIIPAGYSTVTDRAGLAAGAALVAAGAQWVVGAVFNRTLSAKVAALPSGARALTLTAVLVVLGVVHAAVAVALFHPPERAVRSSVASVIGSVVVGWLLLWATSLGRRHEASAARIEALEQQLQWEVARANAELRAQRRSIARMLHGPVQATINAGAIRLDRADGETTDADLAASVQASIREALVNLLAGHYQERDLSVALQRIQGTWAGLCDIVVEDPQGVLELLQHDEPCASAATDIVTEACSDAVRHGQARHVWVTLGQQDNVVEVVVTDDGVTQSMVGEPGLGSTFLEAVTVHWSREVGAHGTTLTAAVPFGPERQPASAR